MRTIIDIKINDVDLSKKVILLREMKNSRPIELPICDTLVKLLEVYINGLATLQSEYLFCTYQGKQLSKRGLQTAIANYNKAKDIDKTSCHLYRHRWAQDFCKTNGNIKKLQTLLNHKTLAMSSYYATIYPTELREDVNQYNSLDLALKRQ